MKYRLVCQKCGYKTRPFERFSEQEIRAWELAIKKHVLEKHPTSPRYHNYVIVELVKEKK